jgi:hypothetical protein
VPNSSRAHGQLCSRFHGNREFEQAWDSLVKFAERFDLTSLNFNVNAPMLGEVFHAHWQNRKAPSGRCRWVSEVPLVWRTHEIGRLAIQGEVPGGQSPFTWSSELMEALCPFETIVLDLLGDEGPGYDDLRKAPPNRAAESPRCDQFDAATEQSIIQNTSVVPPPGGANAATEHVDQPPPLVAGSVVAGC